MKSKTILLGFASVLLIAVLFLLASGATTGKECTKDKDCCSLKCKDLSNPCANCDKGKCKCNPKDWVSTLRPLWGERCTPIIEYNCFAECREDSDCCARKCKGTLKCASCNIYGRCSCHRIAVISDSCTYGFDCRECKENSDCCKICKDSKRCALCTKNKCVCSSEGHVACTLLAKYDCRPPQKSCNNNSDCCSKKCTKQDKSCAYCTPSGECVCHSRSIISKSCNSYEDDCLP